ncbi:MAG TPA: DUF721 domain-containing protein [bacterium (Candidatus Stahlbacteria)]|nr:DUF721 domain-containing protein [Candidatus Stahlbacteria bacterium]
MAGISEVMVQLVSRGSGPLFSGSLRGTCLRREGLNRSSSLMSLLSKSIPTTGRGLRTSSPASRLSPPPLSYQVKRYSGSKGAGLKWPIKIGKIVDEVTGRVKVSLDVTLLEPIWPEIVGEKVANHARPVDLIGDTLYLTVDSSAWFHHLFLLKGEIVKKVVERFPRCQIREIRMVLRDG